MVSVLLVLNALICVGLVILILLQRSDPASGGMFGGAGGASQAHIRNPLARPTAILAALFIVFSIVLAVMNNGSSRGASVMANVAAKGAPIVSSTQPVALPEASLLPTFSSPSAPAVSPSSAVSASSVSGTTAK
jgi:preprotein translocase subunit SecG